VRERESESESESDSESEGESEREKVGGRKMVCVYEWVEEVSQRT